MRFVRISTLARTLRLLSVLPLTVLTMTSCDGDDPTEPTDPTATISSPSPGLTEFEGTAVQLAGSATDPQDGILAGPSLRWSSSIDGDLGTGSTLEISDFSVGIHTVVLSAVDSDGHVGRASVSLAIQELDFLDGTPDDPQIAIIVSTLANSLRMVQLGDQREYRDIPLGASSAVTPTGVSIQGEKAAVPLGNAASVALIDLRSRQIEGYFLFASGNTTGSAFVGADVLLLANQETDQVGRVTLDQASQSVTETVDLAPFPTAVVPVSDSLALVISSNLDDSYMPDGDGVVTALDPRTMTVLGTVRTGGTNPQYGALGPDGRLYVVNTGDYVSPSSLAVIEPQALALETLVGGFPSGSGHVHVDPEGRVHVSGFFFGTVIWDSVTESFIKGPEDPVCAPLSGGGCRGAMSSYRGTDGALYQAFFGSPSQGLPAWIFLYDPVTYTLADSIAPGLGPADVQVHSFRPG